MVGLSWIFSQIWHYCIATSHPSSWKTLRLRFDWGEIWRQWVFAYPTKTFLDFQNALYLCRDCPFSLWRPENGEVFTVVCKWLIDYPPATPQNQLARSESLPLSFFVRVIQHKQPLLASMINAVRKSTSWLNFFICSECAGFLFVDYTNHASILAYDFTLQLPELVLFHAFGSCSIGWIVSQECAPLSLSPSFVPFPSRLIFLDVLSST
jgi:hypothetical protein